MLARAYIKVLLMIALPVIVLIIDYGFWIFYAMISKNWGSLKNQAISTLLITLFMLYPNIVTQIFSLFE